MKASCFQIFDDELYRKSFIRPLLLCLKKKKKKREILSEIHEGQVGKHYEGRALQ